MINANHQQLREIVRWAVDVSNDPAVAVADWLARDIEPERESAVAMLTDPDVTLATLRKAKTAFKTMRIVGETAADRRLAARLYLGSIAAALVRHGQRISQQSDAALQRALVSLLDDPLMPGPLRDLAGSALCALRNGEAVG